MNVEREERPLQFPRNLFRWCRERWTATCVVLGMAAGFGLGIGIGTALQQLSPFGTTTPDLLMGLEGGVTGGLMGLGVAISRRREAS